MSVDHYDQVESKKTGVKYFFSPQIDYDILSKYGCIRDIRRT